MLFELHKPTIRAWIKIFYYLIPIEGFQPVRELIKNAGVIDYYCYGYVNALCKQGLLEKERKGRTIFVKLTPKGIEVSKYVKEYVNSANSLNRFLSL